jgi:hypothetical protein
MSGTLQSLAGAAFSVDDVVSQMHTSLEPEQLVLDNYVFLPHARTGIAAALTQPFDWDGPTQATVEMKVPVIDDRGALDAEMTVYVHGPADVTEIDPRQVIREFPRADAADAEIDDLVHVEFDRPDLPWLFTPMGPDGDGRLVPWITLVVTEQRHLAWGERRGSTRRAKIHRSQLQPLTDAWAWAHAQVMGAKPATAQTEPTLERRLSEVNAAHNLSRLLCPRRLAARTHYVACVVPTFLAGVHTGLGLPPVTTLAPAWSTAQPVASDAESLDELPDAVELPVYYSWSFTTGEDGNFESLARRLRPAVAPPGVGRRRVDATQPWAGLEFDAADPGAQIVVEGPVVSPQRPTSADGWPSEAEQQWSQPVTDELIGKLNRPDVQAHASSPGPNSEPSSDRPIVAPPLYGSNHARQPRIETESDDQPAWFRELNLDPRNRIVAGLGTRVVQAEQEDLMAAAWDQVAGLEAVNRALRLAQLAKHVSASLHRRHLARFPDSALLKVTERVHTKVFHTPHRSVYASLADSSLPTAVTIGAFRRLTRDRGPIVRTALAALPKDAVDVEVLTVETDHFTTEWVHVYSGLDGVNSLSALAKAYVTADIVAQIAPAADPDALLATWDKELAGLAPPDHLAPKLLGTLSPPATTNLGPVVVAALMRRIVRPMPTLAQMGADPEAAITGAVLGQLMRALADVALKIGMTTIELPRSEAARLGLTGADDRRHLVVDVFLSHAGKVIKAGGDHQHEPPLSDLGDVIAGLTDVVSGVVKLPGNQLLAGLETIGARVVADEKFVDGPRHRVDARTLDLVESLDSIKTVPARIKARLTAGSGRMPDWLQPGWFDDERIEPVMAHPRFKHPMYEPLDRYDRDWMIPGLGLIKKPEIATLLQTNSRFVESYLVGLNHEMGRELLWREFPTDQRGTYFDSFWTGATELVADMHQQAWQNVDGALGSHVNPTDGQLVLLVRGDLIRRYPGVVAHAVLQKSMDKGIPLFVASPALTLFHVHLAPNVLLAGFELTLADIHDDPNVSDDTWWFTLSENPTEPRFGLDPSRPSGVRSRDNLIWDDFGTPIGGFLDATTPMNPLEPSPDKFSGPAPQLDISRWGATSGPLRTTSAQVAYLLFQLPARAAFLGTRMVQGATTDG